MQQRIKLDPVAYVILAGVVGLQLYGMRSREADAREMIEMSDRVYQDAVFDSGTNKGVMHQVFRQNEVDRDLLKSILYLCAR